MRDTGRGEFYFAVIRRPGRDAAEVLPRNHPGGDRRPAVAEIDALSRRPRCAGCGRSVSVVCLFDGAVLPLPLGQIPVGRTTRGHRFLSEGEIAVDDAADYLEKPRSGPCHARPRPPPRADRGRDLERLAAAEGLTVKPDPGLLDEVTGLVEWPVVLIGRIDGVHGTAARGAGDRDAHAPEIFFLPEPGRQPGAALPGRRQQPDGGRRRRRSSPATSGCCAPASPTPSSSGTRTARCGSKTASSAEGPRLPRQSSAASTTRSAVAMAVSSTISGLAQPFPRRGADVDSWRSGPRSLPRPICRPAWSASFPNCRA